MAAPCHGRTRAAFACTSASSAAATSASAACSTPSRGRTSPSSRDVAGTTTDPVEKPMELLPLGPVLFIDTAGIDDDGALGELRAKRTTQVFDRTDLGVLVTEAGSWGEFEDGILDELRERKAPVVVVFNKCRPGRQAGAGAAPAGAQAHAGARPPPAKAAACSTSARRCSTRRRRTSSTTPRSSATSCNSGELAVLVVPIDKEAPRGPADPAAGAEHPRPPGQRRHGARGQGARAAQRLRRASTGRRRSWSPTRRRSSRWPPTRRPRCR